MSIRFIHAADFHLDRPFKGLTPLPPLLYKTIVDAPFQALHKMVTTAIEKEVDFVVISGDVFDQAHPSLRAEQRFIKEMERLSKVQIPVFLIHGNHDPLDERRLSVKAETLTVFSEEVEVKSLEIRGERVHLYGFSYPTRHVTDDRTGGYQKLSGADYHIGLLHGSVKGDIEQDTYAPFEIKSLVEKGFDYWALGHIHKRQCLTEHPPIYYSGSPQGLSLKETGEKGIQLVSLNKGKCQVEFIRTASCLFDTLTIDMSGMDTRQAFISYVEETKDTLRQRGVPRLVRLILQGQSPLHEEFLDPHHTREWLDLFQDGEEEHPHFIWISEFISDTLPVYPRTEWKKESHFLGDVVRLIDETTSLMPFSEELYHHPKARKFLEPLTKDQQSSILKEAELLLVKALHEQRGEDVQ